MRVIKTAAATALVLGGWSAALGVASADPPTPAPPPPSAPKTSIDADGIYKVGTDIAPGTYASAGPVKGTCSWKRASAANETIDNAITKKPQVVAIEATDGTFKTSGCQTWTLTDATPPPPVNNLQAQAAMAMINGLMGGSGGFLGGGGGATPAPAVAPAPTATGPLPGPAAAPAPAPTGPLPGPAAEPPA